MGNKSYGRDIEIDTSGKITRIMIYNVQIGVMKVLAIVEIFAMTTMILMEIIMTMEISKQN